MTPSGIKHATFPLVAQCLNNLPHVTNWEMPAKRNTSSAFALLLSLDSKSVTIFAETRRIRLPETCLPTFYATHTKLSPYLCSRYEIDHAHLLCADHERFLRPHTLLRTQSHLYTNNCDISQSHVGLHVKCIVYVRFNQNQDVPTNFCKTPKSAILCNSLGSMSWCFTHTPDRRTDITRLIATVSRERLHMNSRIRSVII